MDLSGIEHLIPNLAAFFNVDPATILLIVTIFVALCNLAGRIIPDDATGVLGTVRKVCKLIGLYASNRVTKGVSVNSVANVLLDSKVTERGEGGKFVATKTVEEAASNLKSHWLAGIGALAIAMLMLGGCTTAQMSRVNSIANSVCQSAPAAQAVLDQFAESGQAAKAQKFLDALHVACPLLLIYLDYSKAESVGVVAPPAVQ